ncbi:competence/damage-inducible protein A [SAR202 cluster bacterium AC-409-J13_OGT_754m]|nr:competence/damage-inducible protein A [SAR202 cluster bacterium AC-409-J13_OGT_754m]
MNGEILALGTELLMGELTDTNSSYIASRLPHLGISVQHISLIRDDLEDLTASLELALSRSDIIFTTGGLGPTHDDITREAIGRVLNEDLKIDPVLIEDLKKWFRQRGMPMSDANNKQAMRIPSAEAIPNSQGTAPGWWVEKNGKVIVAMPGPPGELYNIWEHKVAPRLKASISGQVIMTRNIKTINIGESALAEKILPFTGTGNPYLGIYAKRDGVHLRIISSASTEAKARKMIAPIEKGIIQSVGAYVWGFDEDTPEKVAAESLLNNGYSLAVMESCTGGLLSSTITDVPGSSKFFKGGIVAYSNEAKIESGVPKELIEKYGAISEETAKLMAKAICIQMNADVGIGITGVAGPSEQEGKPLGTVCLGISVKGKQYSEELLLPPRREVVKTRATATALILLRRKLMQA